jgi:hypothetical protein
VSRHRTPATEPHNLVLSKPYALKAWSVVPTRGGASRAGAAHAIHSSAIGMRDRSGRMRWAALPYLAALSLWFARESRAAGYLSGIITNGRESAFVEVRLPNFHGSDAHVASRFRCRGNLCYAPWGEYSADNASSPSTGSFVFTKTSRGHQPFVACTFSMFTTPFCSLHGTVTCPPAGVNWDVYLVDIPCSRPAHLGESERPTSPAKPQN